MSTQFNGLPITVFTPIRCHNGQCEVVENAICQEAPLTLVINGQTYTTIMRTPGLEEELALGCCFTENLIATAADVTALTCHASPADPFIQRVELTIPALEGRAFARTATLKSSSGAVNHLNMLSEVLQHIPPLTASRRFDVRVLDHFSDQLDAAQPLRARCGATHAAALFDAAGTLLFCAEDVGRHNGLDKLIGYILRQRIVTEDKLLMLSSRASFEMMHKAVRIALPVVASVSAPTELALRVADALRCTYVSFLKRGGFYIYTHPWRFGLGDGKKIV